MSPSTALVGVTTYYSEVAWGPWRRRASAVPAPYFELVAAAGARPVLLPPCRSAPGGAGDGAGAVVDALDALVLIGGGDLDPARYGQDAEPTVGGVDAARDISELALLASALKRDLPVLAICRGLQLLNVFLGGTLHQHLPDVIGSDRHQPAPGEFSDVEVLTVPGTGVAGVMGPRGRVRCSHHQAIDRLGRGLVVSARSTDAPAGVIEAVELVDRHFVVGVQWHPEEAGDGGLFDALVAAVTAGRAVAG